MSEFEFNDHDEMGEFDGGRGGGPFGPAAYALFAGAAVVLVLLFFALRSCGAMVPLTIWTPYDIKLELDGKRLFTCSSSDDCPRHPEGKIRVFTHQAFLYPGVSYEVAAFRDGQKLEVVNVTPDRDGAVFVEFDGDQWGAPSKGDAEEAPRRR